MSRVAYKGARPCLELPVYGGACALVPGDIHAGAQDDEVLRILTNIAADAGAQFVVMIGDNTDCNSLSRHPKPSKTALDLATLQVEDKALEGWVSEWAGSGMQVYALMGNHEDWAFQLIDANLALHGMGVVNFFPRTYAHVTGIVPRFGYIRAGRLIIDHGDLRRGNRDALAMSRQYPGMSIMFGHSHRMGEVIVTVEKHLGQVVHGYWNIGHCSKPEHHIHYAGGSVDQWTQGGALVTWHAAEGGGLYHEVELLRVLRTKKGYPFIMHRGKVYK